MYGIGPDECNSISACEVVKEIWECLKITHEGTSEVKESKFDMLTMQYKSFIMKQCETIQEMDTRFTDVSMLTTVKYAST